MLLFVFVQRGGGGVVVIRKNLCGCVSPAPTDKNVAAVCQRVEHSMFPAEFNTLTYSIILQV